MSAIEEYRAILKDIRDWNDYLIKESRLPGARSNLELLYACSDLASREMLEQWLEFTPQKAPENTPQCFLACCGVVGLGRLPSEGDYSRLAVLRYFASDPRWRVRESVCMALQRFGQVDMPTLLNEMSIWANGAPYEQRVAIATLCEPVLLKNKVDAASVLILLNQETEDSLTITDRKQEDFRVLRKGLAYCWSVAVVALPEQRKPFIGHWLNNKDPDIRWIMKQNLQKNRLIKMDSEWVRQYINEMENKK